MPQPASTPRKPHKIKKWSGPATCADWVWMSRFEHRYDQKSRTKAEARAARRARNLAIGLRHDHHDNPGAARPIQIPGGFGHAQTRELVKDRLLHGFRWRGGPVADNIRDLRAAFHEPGLISDQHPILKLFVTKLRRARNLYIGDTKSERFTSDSKLLALDAAYVEDNRVMCGVLRIELGHVVSAAEVEDACQTAGVPHPNIIVGWKDRDGAYVHPHLIWLLHESLPLGDEAPKRFRSLYRGVLRGLTKALLPIGADPAGLLNSHRHKNPLSPLWDRKVLAEQPYQLRDLAKQVDITVRMATLNELAVLRGAGSMKPRVPDHPNPTVAIASNWLFSELAGWARTAVVRHRAEGGDRPALATAVAAEADRLMSALSGDLRRKNRRALATVASAANWTWTKFRAPTPRKRLSPEEIAQRESDGARQTAAKRRAKTKAIIIAAATMLQAKSGQTPTQVAVLAAVQAAGIKTEKTVRSYWPDVLAALPTGNLPSPYVKKNEADGMDGAMNQQPPPDVTDPGEQTATSMRDREARRDDTIATMKAGSPRPTPQTCLLEGNQEHAPSKAGQAGLRDRDLEAAAGPGVPRVRPHQGAREAIGPAVPGRSA